MSLLFIRYFFICLCSTYSYYKIQNIGFRKIPNFLVLFLNAFLISINTFLLSDSEAVFRIISMVAINFFILTIWYNISFDKSLFTIVISYGLSYVLLYLAIPLICFIYILVFKYKNLIPYNYAHIPVGIFQFFLTISLFKNIRLRNGISSMLKHRKIYHGIILSLVFIFAIAYTSCHTKETLINQFIINIFFLTFSISFLYYWQHRITQTYLEKLRLANEKSLENEIAELQEDLKTLQADNHRLTQIVHKDNKLVPAMETTVLEFLQSANVLSPEELVSRGNELCQTLQEMAKERKGILSSLPPTNNSLPSSGLIAIDGLLSYMEKRATEGHIKYKVKTDENIKDLILATLSEDDLRHLLSDLIENAIIATNHSELLKQISIHLGSLQDKLLLEISDSGIPFNPETYQHFGYEHCSSHPEDGGTGTGLMDIWSIKKKYKASLYIYEYESSSNVYTKKISYLFDSKNHFLLKTYRDKEIKNSLIRGDLHVFPHEAE